jgi:hypothetical protein
LTGYLAKSLVFLEFWLGVKNLHKLAIFFKNFQNRTLVLLEIANFSKILLVNLGFGRSVTKSC